MSVLVFDTVRYTFNYCISRCLVNAFNNVQNIETSKRPTNKLNIKVCKSPSRLEKIKTIPLATLLNLVRPSLQIKFRKLSPRAPDLVFTLCDRYGAIIHPFMSFLQGVTICRPTVCESKKLYQKKLFHSGSTLEQFFFI